MMMLRRTSVFGRLVKGTLLVHVYLRGTQIETGDGVLILSWPGNFNHWSFFYVFLPTQSKRLNLSLDMAIVVFDKEGVFFLCCLKIEALFEL